MKFNRRGTAIMMMGIVISVCIGISSYVMAENPPPSTGKTISVPLKDIQRFSTVIMQIKRYYIEPIKDDAMFENAMKGMVSSLDPHSAYLDEEDLKDLQTATTGKFGGIGVEIVPEVAISK